MSRSLILWLIAACIVFFGWTWIFSKGRVLKCPAGYRPMVMAGGRLSQAPITDFQSQEDSFTCIKEEK